MKKGLCTTKTGNAVGGHHDSHILPYVATAIRGGKWNMSEYGDILTKWFSEFDIDPNVRGII